jgi:hypothetical protein
MMSGSVLLGDDFMSEEDIGGGDGSARKSMGVVDIEQLKEKLKSDNDKKRKLVRNSSSKDPKLAAVAPANQEDSKLYLCF